MALPWHIPLETALKNMAKKPTPPQPSLFKHFSNINVHQNPTQELQTGIMCDIGIFNRETMIIEKLIAAGMTIARLNMDDLEPEDGLAIIQSIRQAVYQYSTELEYVYPLAVVMDIIGPEIVTGELKGGPKTTVDLVKFGTVRLSTDISWKESGTAECLYIRYDNLTEVLPRDIIYIDCLTPGKVKLIVLAVGDDSLECSIVAGGLIGSKMGVRITHPNKEGAKSGHRRESCSGGEVIEKKFDRIDEQIAWALKAEVDGLLILNTETAQDILNIKSLLGNKEKYCLVFACIDTVVAFDNIDSILAVADGIYIDRCILSVDLPVEKIFIAEKVILAKCNEAGKPCICKAVLNEQTPTICVIDIANLVLDGADVISFEFNYNSPLQKFASYDSVKMAEHCLAAAAVVCRHSERIIWRPNSFGNTEIMHSDLDEPTKAIAITAAELAVRARAVVIICLTTSGRTAKVIAHALPNCIVLGVTKGCHAARQLRFWRGVRALHYFEQPKTIWVEEVESRIRAGIDYCKAKRLLRAGEPYVLVNTALRRDLRICDNVRLFIASDRATHFQE